MARVVIHARFDQPSRENPWTDLIGVEPAAHPYHDWFDRLTAECYRPFAFARILVDGEAVSSIVNLFERCSFDIAPALAAWLARNQPVVYERMVAADRSRRTAVARPWVPRDLRALSDHDLEAALRWGLADFKLHFDRDADAIFLEGRDLVEPVLSAVARTGVSLVVTDDEVDDGPAVSVYDDAAGGSLRVMRRHRAVSEALGRGVRTTDPADLATRLEDLAGSSSLAVAVVDGHAFGHHVHYAERALAVLVTRELSGRGLAPAAAVEAAADAVVTSWRPPAPAPAGTDEHWRRPLAGAIEAIGHHAREVCDGPGRAQLRDPWVAWVDYGSVMTGSRSLESFLGEHLLPGGDGVEALTILEALRHLLEARGASTWVPDPDSEEALACLRRLGRAVDLLIERGGEPPVVSMLELLDQVPADGPGITSARDLWERQVLPARADAFRSAAHLALIRQLRGGSPVRVGCYDVKVERHARSKRADLQLDTGRVITTHRRTMRTHTLTYAVMGDRELNLAGAVRTAGSVLDDDTDGVALHKALAGPASVDALRRLLVDSYGPLVFGFDALIPEAAPRVLGDVAQGALSGLVRRAVATADPVDTAAVPRFVRLVRSAGVRLDIAPAQEALYQELASGRTDEALLVLGAELGLAVGQLTLS